MVLEDGYCERCDNEYTNKENRFCNPCYISSLKKITFTSGNEKIDNFIQEMQLKINSYNDIIFEWIPYDQFDEFKAIKDDDTKYSAMWDVGPLSQSEHYYGCKRDTFRKVILKYLNNSQNITDEILNEV